VTVAPQLALENRIVLVAGADRLVEDRGVGGDASQIVILDHGQKTARGQHCPVDVVAPDALAGSVQLT
jgi:hypothetical protein